MAGVLGQGPRGLGDVGVQPDQVLLVVPDEVEGVAGAATDHAHTPGELEANLKIIKFLGLESLKKIADPHAILKLILSALKCWLS